MCQGFSICLLRPEGAIFCCLAWKRNLLKNNFEIQTFTEQKRNLIVEKCKKQLLTNDGYGGNICEV